MIALNVVDVKDFTSKILVKNTFDKFYLCDGEIETFISFRFGGKLNDSYYSTEEQEEVENRTLPLWSEVKPFAYQLIRGKKLPLSFKLVMALSAENVAWLLEHNQTSIKPEDVAGLYMNIKYENKVISIVTGVSFKTFVLDKTLEHIWDATVVKFMKQNEIAVEIV